MTLDVEHHFVCSFAICVSSLVFGEMSVKVFGSLFNGLFVFSLGVNLKKKKKVY